MQVTDEMIEAMRLAVDLVERDVIRVRPSDRDELMSALATWQAALAAVSEARAETYYTKGKDAEYFENLPDKDFAWAITCASQDLNDSDENVSAWMPVTAMLSSAADRIRSALVAPPAQEAVADYDLAETIHGEIVRVRKASNSLKEPVAAPPAVPADMVLVPVAAMEWLNGEGPDADGHWFGDAPDDGKSGAFWWRSKFRRMLTAAQEGR